MTDDFAAEDGTPSEPDDADAAGSPEAKADGDRVSQLMAANWAEAVETRRRDTSTQEMRETQPLLEYDALARGERDEGEAARKTWFRERRFGDVVREWVRGLFVSQLEREAHLREQLAELDAAVERDPDVAANYVLRGELLLQIGCVEEAIADFERGEALAAKEFAESNWGIVAQTMRDRARQGLRQARSRKRRHF